MRFLFSGTAQLKIILDSSEKIFRSRLSDIVFDIVIVKGMHHALALWFDAA